MTAVRLVADDLTGALDAAAEFVPLAGPVPVLWDPAAEVAGSVALDIGTREAGSAAARCAMRAAVPVLAEAARPGGLAFKKLDSLLRGSALPELAECMVAGPWRHAVLAPAFPFQGRATRGSQQFDVSGGAARPVGPNLVDALTGLGIAAQAWDGSAAGLRPGVTVFDAQTDGELDAAVAAGRAAAGAVLWCGTGGLARALAGTGGPAAPPALPGPILGLFGSDQTATAAQLAACLPHWTALDDDAQANAVAIADRLRRHGIALLTHALPPDTARGAAAARIAAAFAALVARLDPPGTLAVAGGETLRGLCAALGASSLLVQGRVLPGVPISVLRGGRWDGVVVVSKSGAFGPPSLLRDLLLPRERTPP